MADKQSKLEESITLIHKALSTLDRDFATSTIRSHLLAALREAGHVQKKRRRKALSAFQEAAEKARNLHNDWWRQIEENVRKTAHESKEKESKPDSSDAASSTNFDLGL